VRNGQLKKISKKKFKQKSHWAIGRRHACGDAKATSSNDLQKSHIKNDKKSANLQICYRTTALNDWKITFSRYMRERGPLY